jgi:hypothetical protein
MVNYCRNETLANTNKNTHYPPDRGRSSEDDLSLTGFMAKSVPYLIPGTLALSYQIELLRPREPLYLRLPL